MSSSGMLGFISRALVVWLPEKLGDALKMIAGEGFYWEVVGWADYFMKKRNPAFQITYLAILNGAYILWLNYGQPLLPVRFVGSHHSLIALISVIVCHISFVAACYISPGHITRENHDCYMHPQYDGTDHHRTRCLNKKTSLSLIDHVSSFSFLH